MALVGYSTIILRCIFIENVLEVEEESMKSYTFIFSSNVDWHISAHTHPIDVLYFDMDILYDFHLSIIYFSSLKFILVVESYSIHFDPRRVLCLR